MKTLQISAGGFNTRLATFLEKNFSGIPKHALPLSQEEHDTLLTRIIKNANDYFSDQVVWANEKNIKTISTSLSIIDDLQIRTDKHMTGPLGPAVRTVIGGVRAYSCAGDHFSKHSWQKMASFHETSPFPATILVARSEPFDKAATFQVDELTGQVLTWERKDRSLHEDFINVGCYIFDPHPQLLRIFENLSMHKEEGVFSALSNEGLLGAYISPEKGFNVNTQETYSNLLHYLKET